MRTLQTSSLAFLIPTVHAVVNTFNQRGCFFTHVSVAALMVTSLANHSRPHDGPVFDFLDYMDKVVIVCATLGAALDILFYTPPNWRIALCSLSVSVACFAYAYSFTLRENKSANPSAENVHILVHIFGAIALWLVIV